MSSLIISLSLLPLLFYFFYSLSNSRTVLSLTLFLKKKNSSSNCVVFTHFTTISSFLSLSKRKPISSFCFFILLIAAMPSLVMVDPPFWAKLIISKTIPTNMGVLAESWCFCKGVGKSERMKATIFTNKASAMARISDGTGFLIHRNLLLTTHANLPSVTSAESSEIRLQNGVAATLVPHRYYCLSALEKRSISILGYFYFSLFISVFYVYCGNMWLYYGIWSFEFFFSFCIVLCFRYTTNFTTFFIAVEVGGCDWFMIKVVSVMLPCENYVPLRSCEKIVKFVVDLALLGWLMAIGWRTY